MGGLRSTPFIVGATSIELDGGIKETNFKQLSVLYKKAMARGKVGPVPVLEAEDETGIIGQISYNQRTDELLGFCGVKGTEHKCLDYFTVSVGEGEEGYKSIINAFEQCKIWKSYLAQSSSPKARLAS